MRDIIIGVGLAWIIGWFLVSFVCADFFWPRGMFETWSKSDRFALLYFTVCVGTLGGLASWSIRAVHRSV